MLDLSKILWVQQNDSVFSSAASGFSNINASRRVTGGPQPVPFYANVFGLTVYENPRSSTNYNLAPRITNLTAKEIPFQYIDAVPNWSKAANYQDINDILGRFEGFSIYSNSSAQDCQLTLHYHAERETGFGWSLENIERIETLLKSLVLPTTNKQYAPPPRMLLNIGYLWRSVPVIIKNVNIEFVGPYMADGLRAHQRKITIEMRTNYDLSRSMSRDEVIANVDIARNRYELFAARQTNIPTASGNRLSAISSFLSG